MLLPLRVEGEATCVGSGLAAVPGARGGSPSAAPRPPSSQAASRTARSLWGSEPCRDMSGTHAVVPQAGRAPASWH